MASDFVVYLSGSLLPMVILCLRAITPFSCPINALRPIVDLADHVCCLMIRQGSNL
jgi:hypothetical protein